MQIAKPRQIDLDVVGVIGLMVVLIALAISRTRNTRLVVASVGVAAIVLAMSAWIPRLATPQTAHPMTAWDVSLRLYGIGLKGATDPDARIAVYAAGAITYYSERKTIDILGLVDPVVAHTRAHPGRSYPAGHQKWDFEHTVGQLRPDVVAQFWSGWGVAGRKRLLELGYLPMRLNPKRTPIPITYTLWVQRSSHHVRWNWLVPSPAYCVRLSPQDAVNDAQC